MQRFQTTHWARIKQSTFSGTEAGFDKFLRQNARATQIAFQRLMARYDGNPVGIECKSRTGDAWAFVMPNLDGDTPWKIQYADLDGFSGHCGYRGIVEAVEAMVREGYVEVDAGRLDQLCTTARWQLGMNRSALRDKLNRGLIDWHEMLAGFAALGELQAQG